MFAAVHGNVIQLYATYTFENVGNLKGHNGKVRSIVWSQDDSKIISCGVDGAVYEWSVYTSKREGESVLKTCSYTCAAVSPEGGTTFAVGSDKTLKEISDSQVLLDFLKISLRFQIRCNMVIGSISFKVSGVVWSGLFLSLIHI